MKLSLLTPTGRVELGAFYRDALLLDVIPFWLRHGLDRECGGLLTALDRDGTVIDTDKSIWFQGRGAWMFATLYNTVEKKSEWLDVARSAIDFLRRYGADADGKLYFTVTREGCRCACVDMFTANRSQLSLMQPSRELLRIRKPLTMHSSTSLRI